MARQNISSGNAWEPIFGFSRAVRVGNHVFVTGTAATDMKGATVGVGDVAAQTRRCFEIIETALAEAGASLKDVVRTRNMVVNIDDWETVLRIHGEVFGSIRPASVMFQVSRFIDPEWLVEIEVDAVMSGEDLGDESPELH
jgi:enamine deaminase RidA (YjgF/YER057c/UK114 family)